MKMMSKAPFYKKLMEDLLMMPEGGEDKMEESMDESMGEESEGMEKPEKEGVTVIKIEVGEPEEKEDELKKKLMGV